MYIYLYIYITSIQEELSWSWFSCLDNPEDQLWGVIARGVANQSHLQTVDDAMDAIRKELGKVSIRDWLGANANINVLKLDATRGWRQHIPAAGVRLEGGLLRDTTGNHLFLSMLRKGECFWQNCFPKGFSVQRFVEKIVPCRST